MYQGQVDPRLGTISPTGWYAFYPSGRAESDTPPAWLELYDGSLTMVHGGTAYAALKYNDKPNSCRRTVQLIAPSGQTCFELELEDTRACTAFPDALWPDGTLVLQDATFATSCVLTWWPELARPAQ